MTNYEKIAQEHERLFGTDKNYRKHFKNPYSDKTHFVFELIQNADDNQSNSLEFRLDEEELLVSNDGCRFTEKDVRSICSIGASNKDLTHIGTFGIGFKAVYSYTDCPEIYSGDERFRIRDLTQPEGIDKTPPRIAEQIDQGRTVFRLPFKRRLRKEAIVLLKHRLCDLKAENLLFLRHLEMVRWRDERDGQMGYCWRGCRTHDEIPKATQIELMISMNGDIQLSEAFLVFRKEMRPPPDVVDDLLQEEEYEDEQQRIQQSSKELQAVDVAFKLCEGKIVAVNNPCLFAYLPTQKETHLRFLIQARYQTTPSRENIRLDTLWNDWLVKETANFLPEVLEQLMVGGLLDPAFFNVLPLDQDYEGDELHPIFDPIAESVKVAMSEQSLVPIQNDGYAKAKNVYYPHNKHLRTLIDSSCIYSGSSWLHPEIRRNTRAFDVMDEAGVKEVNVSEVLDWLEKNPLNWFEDRPDEWLCSLYAYFSNLEGVSTRVRNLPLVRLENGQHLNSVNHDVFFPPRTKRDSEAIKPFLNELPILRSALFETDEEQRHKIRAFLMNLEVNESRAEDIVRKGILPQYSQADNTKPTVEQNRQHLGYLFKVRDEIFREDPCSLEEEISKTPILLAYCKDSGVRRESSEFIPPVETYLSQTYTGNADLEAYFSVCDDVWFVDDGYLEGKSDPEKWVEFLKQIGAVDFPRFIRAKIYAAPEECQNRGFERRSVADGNDNIHYNYIEECTFDGLSAVLHQIETYENVAFSKTLWCLLVKAVSSEEQSNRDSLFQSKYCRFYYSWDRKTENALFYLDLKKYPWLFDEQSQFHPPSDCFDPKTREVLGDSVLYLHPEFDLSSPPARWLAEKLGVHLNADTRGVLNYLQSLSKKSDTEVCVDDVKPLYEFLAEQDEPLSEKFKEEPLIFTPSPEPHWRLANQVFWEDESAIFSNSRGYLKTHYGDALKSFFISTLDVSERASSLDYMRAIREVASKEQAGDGEVRGRVKKLYDQLQLDLQVGKLVDKQARAAWEETCNAKCWLGKCGNEWNFFFRHELVWDDHPQRARLFEGKIPFWPFGDALSDLVENLKIVSCAQSKVKFYSYGHEIKNAHWSERVRDLYPRIHAFLKSPQLGNEKDSEPAKILAQLSVCRVEEFTVTYKLNGVRVSDPDPRPSFLGVTNRKGILWVGLSEPEDEYPELIGDALQDYFGSKELREFVKDLLLARNQHKTLDKWKQRGLDTNLCVSLLETDTEGNIEDSQDSNDENLSSETQSEDTNLEEDEPSIEDQKIIDPEISSGEDDSLVDESESQTLHPNTGGSHSGGGGHWNSTSGGGGYGGHGGGGGGGEDRPHKDLKTYLAENPSLLGEGLECEKTEYEFISQDRADILLIDDYGNPVTVEVESHIPSGNYVGVWQAVKYKHLAAVKFGLPCEQVRSILAAPEIPDNVKMECERLGIEFREITRQ